MATTILIVDDSRVSRMMITAIVKDAQPDWTIIEASNGDEAIKLADGQTIENMILDYNMPGINGLELAEILIKDHAESRITLLTANVQDSIRNQASALGINFKDKPITDEKIHDIIGG